MQLSPAQKNFAWAAAALAAGLLLTHFVPQRRWYGAFAVAIIYTGLGIRDLIQSRK